MAPKFIPELRGPEAQRERWLAENRIGNLKQRILAPLFRRFCENDACEPTHAEIAPCGEDAREPFVHAMLREWKFRKVIAERYGGAMTVEELGPNPFEALQHWLEQEEADGAFKIFVPVLRDGFYQAVLAHKGTIVNVEQSSEVFASPSICKQASHVIRRPSDPAMPSGAPAARP
ncbi:MAG TPA: hypothetical protein VGK30_11785 [Candidatus Binatia bacterium]